MCNKKVIAFFIVFCLLCFPFSVNAATKLTKPTGLASTSVKTNINLTWNKTANATGYKIYQYKSGSQSWKKIKTTKSKFYSVPKLTRGKTYKFRIRAYQKKNGKVTHSPYSKTTTATIPSAGTSTLRTFLKVSLRPVGSTMYIWGGGWNKGDTKAGTDAVTIGVSPTWKKFAKKQKSSYDYKKTRYQRRNGLDCSGYVGWVTYNILRTSNGKSGYVYKAKTIASTYASKGWGTLTAKEKVQDYIAGDIMSSSCSDCGHVWIVIGQCEDKSVVLVHSTPAGVQINGTPTPDGNAKSQAVSLASYYMKTYYPSWYKRFPKCSVSGSYLNHYCQMRWDVSGKVIMSDPHGYREKTADEILKDLF